MGQRRGRIGVKGAKNFHLLMKGKITHLALSAWPSQRGGGFLAPSSERIGSAGLEQKRYSLRPSRPCFHFPWTRSEPGLKAQVPTGPRSHSDEIANALGGSEHLLKSLVAYSQEVHLSVLRARPQAREAERGSRPRGKGRRGRPRGRRNTRSPREAPLAGKGTACPGVPSLSYRELCWAVLGVTVPRGSGLAEAFLPCV